MDYKEVVSIIKSSDREDLIAFRDHFQYNIDKNKNKTRYRVLKKFTIKRLKGLKKYE